MYAAKTLTLFEGIPQFFAASVILLAEPHVCSKSFYRIRHFLTDSGIILPHSANMGVMKILGSE
jgi:hypothetical protein